MNEKDNIYEPVKCIVEEVITESSNIKTVVLKPQEAFSFQAGQFASLTVPGVGEAPFTPSSSPFDKEKIEFTVMETGRVTGEIHRLSKGDVIGIRGPYGKPYPLDKFKNKEILLIGGGVGLAPVRALFLALVATSSDYKRIVFCCGAKSPGDYIYKDQLFGEWQELCGSINLSFRITADKKDEDWKYMEGVVTGTLDNLDVDTANSVAVVCGPPIMMKFTTLKLLEIGFQPNQIHLSMERKMYCGVGQCRHCLIGDLYVCKDGPVFVYEDIKDKPNIWV